MYICGLTDILSNLRSIAGTKVSSYAKVARFWSKQRTLCEWEWAYMNNNMLENKTFFKTLSRCSAVNIPQEVKRRYNGINRQTPQGFFSAETGQQEYLFHSYFQIYIYRDFWLYLHKITKTHRYRDSGTMKSNGRVGGIFDERIF